MTSLVITTIIDVSAQNEAMERLRRSEERFAKAFNFSPLKMTITRLSRRRQFVEVNRDEGSCAQGLQPEADLLGKTTLEMGGLAEPGRTARPSSTASAAPKAMSSAYDTRMRHKSMAR